MFIQHPLLLDGVGRDGPFEPVEEFVCYLYMAPNAKGGVDKARGDIFRKGRKELDHIPPTSDALQLHAMHAIYQFKVWLGCIWWMTIYGHWIGSCMVNITCSSKCMSWTSSMWLPGKM